MSPLRLRLRELRQERGLTQLQLSDAAGVRQAAISQLESGQRQRVDLDILERLADALGVEPGELLIRSAKKKRGRP